MTTVLYPMLDECVGLNGRSTDPTVREETAKRLLPHDKQKLAQEYLWGYIIDGKLKVPNTCGLQGLDALRTYYGIKDHPQTDTAYIPKYDAITRFEELGKALGVLEINPDQVPDEGDFVRVNDFPLEHVSCLAKYDPATGIFSCVDGGQGQGSETKLIFRKVVVYKNTLYLVDAENPWVKDQRGHEYANGRPIRTLLRMSKLKQ